jgi:DNA-binding transcriptional regulator PaaX
MPKKEFIRKFIKDIREITGSLADVWMKIPYKGFSPGNFLKSSRGFKNLKQRGIIRDTSHDRFIFTPRGRQWLKQSLFKHSHLRKVPWDKKWRIIIFDIPQEKHIARIRFRNKLKSLGCVMLQKSVFIFPYPCHEEVGDIAGYLEISDYIDILIAESAGYKDQEILKIFGLKR